MKSREGTVVDADDLMAEMINTAKETSGELGKLDGLTQEEADNIARIVGLGALKYFILKVDARKNMTFNPKESIDFNGNTGPFIQYTYARIQSVLRKAKEAGISVPAQLPAGIELSEKEEGLIQMVADFAAIVKQAGEDYSPSLIANYTYDLVKEYNQFYHDFSILREENEAVKIFRLALSENVAKWYVWEWDCLALRFPTECNRDILSYEKALFAICGEGFLFLWLLYFFFLAYLPRLAFGASGSLCSLMISLHASRFKSCGIMSFGIL